MKYAWIAEQDKLFSLAERCAVLNVSVSGYRAWKRGGKPDRKRLSDTQMLALIRSIHAELKGAYGSPRMTRELRARGFSASKERVERLMRDHGIHARHKRRYKVTTDSKHGLPVAENLLARNSTPTAPSQVWTSVITYLWIKNERVHGVRYATYAEIKAAAFEYIEVFYNRKRQHSTLGYRSPVQFLENWIRAHHQEKRVA